MPANNRTLLVGAIACCAALLISGHALAGPVVTVGIDFGQPGDTQSFDGQLTGAGNLHATGGGVGPSNKIGTLQPFVFIPPLDHWRTVVSQFGGNQEATFASSPESAPSSTTEFDFQDQQLIDMRGVDVDLLAGVVAPFLITGPSITTNSTNNILKATPYDHQGDLSGLQFTQTGAALLTPSDASSGSFQLPGKLQIEFSNMRAFVLNLVDLGDVVDFTLTLPFQLTGNYAVSGPQSDLKVELDSGSFSIDAPILWESATASLFESDVLALTFSATTDLAMSLTVSGALHLEQSHLVIPEPASVVLLAVGLTLMGGAFWMRQRARVACSPEA